VREAVSKVIIASLREGNGRSNLIYKKWWDCLLRSQWQLFETASYHYFFERCLKYVSIYKFKFGPTAILRTLGIVNLFVE